MREDEQIWRWLVLDSWRVLHRVVEQTANGDDLEDNGGLAIRWAEGRSACGITARFVIPGIGSRMGLPRCKHCCRKVGVPYGDGTPWNDRSLPDEVKAR